MTRRVGPRPTDGQVSEVARAVAYSYEGGGYPEGLSAWALAFLGPDGGLLSALGEWQAERLRYRLLLDAVVLILGGTAPREALNDWVEGP